MKISAINTATTSRQNFKAHLNVTQQGVEFIRELMYDDKTSKENIVDTFTLIDEKLDKNMTLSLCKNKNGKLIGCVSDGKFASEFTIDKGNRPRSALIYNATQAAKRIRLSRKSMPDAVKCILEDIDNQNKKLMEGIELK